jgi:hypothetical protein
MNAAAGVKHDRRNRASEDRAITVSIVPSFVKRFFEPTFPRHAMAIAADHVASVRVGAAPSRLLENSALVPLAAGIVTPSYAKPNIADREALVRALSQATQRTGVFRKEVNVLIPDATARVFLLTLESLPAKSAEFLPLLQFKVKKSLPYPIEEAAMAYQVQTLTPSHHEVILTVIHRDILREYESVIEEIGLEPGFVTVEHFGVAQLLDKQASDWRSRATLLFRLAPRSFTTTIYKDGYLRFYRAVEKDYLPAQLGALTAEALFDEIYPSLAFFQDKFENKVEMIYLSGLSTGGDRLCSALQKLTECPVTEVRAERAVGAIASHITVDQMSQVFAPLLGVELGAA